ncbi:cytochrome c-type biogenesis protein [Hahella ganghwensis]|uniref:cytochrome c-type biogenesis protein n=1 Tax=Hahella ganghwensis TaxID=286420 RepID=UPI0003773685|nr:cytochrome c-type biogenesis protein [Hahella ganghwensis]
MKSWFGILILFSVVVSGPAFAIDVYEFPDEQTRERYQDLTWELRCPKCQNQNIADSNAPIAQDLRREVHRLLMDGRSDKEIVDFMVERYGDFVFYRPRMSGHTVVLWIAPLVLVLIGVSVVMILGRRNRNAGRDGDALSAGDRERLKQLLEEADHLSDKKNDKS